METSWEILGTVLRSLGNLPTPRWPFTLSTMANHQPMNKQGCHPTNAANLTGPEVNGKNNIASQKSQGICNIIQCKQMVSVTQNLRMVELVIVEWVVCSYLQQQCIWSYKILKNAGQQKFGIEIPSRKDHVSHWTGKGTSSAQNCQLVWDKLLSRRCVLGDFLKIRTSPCHYHTISYRSAADFFQVVNDDDISP